MTKLKKKKIVKMLWLIKEKCLHHPRTTTTMTKLKKSSKPFTNLQRKHFFPLYSWSVLSTLLLPYLLEMKNKVLIFL
jgi:hypothetical protein